MIMYILCSMIHAYDLKEAIGFVINKRIFVHLKMPRIRYRICYSFYIFGKYGCVLINIRPPHYFVNQDVFCLVNSINLIKIK